MLSRGKRTRQYGDNGYRWVADCLIAGQFARAGSQDQLPKCLGDLQCAIDALTRVHPSKKEGVVVLDRAQTEVG